MNCIYCSKVKTLAVGNSLCLCIVLVLCTNSMLVLNVLTLRTGAEARRMKDVYTMFIPYACMLSEPQFISVGNIKQARVDFNHKSKIKIHI